MSKIALRIDDIGSSSKIYERYGRVSWELWGKHFPIAPFANWLFFKETRPFKGWAPYRELSAIEWERIFLLLRGYNGKLTVGITATWVDRKGGLISFPQKYPAEAAKLKEGIEEGLIEIAHHGLTHCVLKGNLYKPRLFFSNRSFHREFYEWLPEEVQRKHIFEAMDILTSYFKTDVVTFIPPGGVWCEVTEKIAAQAGLKFLNSHEGIAPTGKKSNGLIYIGSRVVLALHDKEISEGGVIWLEHKLNEAKEKGDSFCFVKEIGYCLKESLDGERKSE